MSHRTASWCVALVSVLSLPSAALAQSIEPGNDLFHAMPGTSFDLAPQPIPAGFFGPGSLPFDGIIHFTGESLPYAQCVSDPLASVIILRPVPANPPDTIPIQLVQLSLVSVTPIVVRYDVGPEQTWDVQLRLALVPIPLSTMTLRQEYPNGGTFDSQLFVYPHFTFTRSGGSDVRQYETIGPCPFDASGVPWEHVVPPAGSCRSNFCENPQGTTILGGPFGQIVLGSICPEAAVSADELGATPTWGRVKALYR